MFSDEKMMLELRLNLLNKYVDKFVITEANYFHNGKEKKLNFDIKDYPNFKDKIEYIVVNEQPPNLILDNNKENLEEKKILNSIRRDNFQREQLNNYLKGVNENDIIIINDLDEIPNFEEVDLHKIENEILIFKQKMFYYKFNLCYENFVWFGSKATKKKNFKSPQWLRNIKNKKYPYWRIDTYFSKKKYNNIKFIENGGWHFSYLKDPKGVENKLKSIRHHIEYDLNPLGEEKISNLIKNRKLIYDYKADQRTKNKFENNETLKILDEKKLPEYIRKNKNYYKDWLES